MPAGLTRQQQTTLLYIVGTLLSFGLSITLIYSLSSSRTALTKLRQEVESKEVQARNARPPDEAAMAAWKEQENTVSSLLLPDQAVPEFLAEVTQIAADTGIQQRLTVNTDETSLDPGKPMSAEDEKTAAIGIHRYMVLTMKFQGQYSDIAQFLGRLSGLQRPIEYRVVDLKRNAPLIEVQVIVNVYKRDAA